MSSVDSTSPPPNTREASTGKNEQAIEKSRGMGWLARTNSGRKESESLVQPGPRLSDIAEELEGDLVLWDIPNPDVRSGSFTDVYPGTWTSLEGKTIVVAVKLVRTTRHFAPNEITLKKKIGLHMKRETLVWTHIKHRNIHTLLGFRSQPEPHLIVPWCRQGNLINYLHNNPRLSPANRLLLIVQAGRGLAYLHSQTPPICHGNIKPENVLINDSDEATLSDFGLSRLLESFIPHTRLAASGEVLVGSSYMAPELWAEEKSTCEGDVYAFGGLILIVMSGKAPFEGDPPVSFVLRVVQGEHPKTQSHPNLPSWDPLWGLMRECWDLVPQNRPAMSVVVAELEKEVERRT